MIKTVKTFLFAVGLTGFCIWPVFAEPEIAETPCDLEYYKSLESRAWLEAQREITQNQNLIVKPDSVLAYTCFDQFGAVLAGIDEYGDNGLFSETERWGKIRETRTVEHKKTMDKALNDFVAPSLKSYIESNFYPPSDENYKYLGGRVNDLPRELNQPYYRLGDTPMNADEYNCDIMNKVWKKAKCYDFQPAEREDQDGFFTFAEHSEEDKRKLPEECANPDIWKDNMEEAGLERDAETPWNFDKVQVYYERFWPEKCGDYAPLPTGVLVRTTDPSLPEKYNEKICIPPGCHYRPTDMNAGECTTN